MLLRPGSAARRLAAPRPQPPPGPIIFRCGGVMRNAPAFLDDHISRPPSNVGGEPGGTARLRLGRGAVASPSASLLFDGGTRNEERPGLRLPQGLGLRGAAPRCTGPAPGLASLGRRLPTRALGLRCWYLSRIGAAGMLAFRCGLPGLPFERCLGVAPRWRHISPRCSHRLPTASSPRESRGPRAVKGGPSRSGGIGRPSPYYDSSTRRVKAARLATAAADWLIRPPTLTRCLSAEKLRKMWKNQTYVRKTY